MPSDSLDLLWPTPLLKISDPIAIASNDKLRNLILRSSRREPGVHKTNLGGWQSDVDFFERDDPACALLRTRAYHAVFRYLQETAPRGATGHYEVSIGSAWANLNNRSHENSPHMHPGAQLSGVYYVDDGGNREGGLRLVDPRAQASMIPVPPRWSRGAGEHVRLLAQPGLFVIWPAWLQHYVVGHQGDRPRVSVSFNVRLTFPDDDGGAGVYSAGGGGERVGAEPRLTFTVPPHHQKSFLEEGAAQDMVVG